MGSKMTETQQSKRQQRQQRINIRVSDEMLSRAQSVADDMAIPLSTLAAYALSDYVTNKERQMSQNTMIADAMAKTVKDMLSGDVFEANVEQASSHMLGALAKSIGESD